VAARYGGEEFALLLADTQSEATLTVAEEICSAVEALGISNEGVGTEKVVTVSIGVANVVARLGGKIKMPETLIQLADGALYRAKDRGRNRVETALAFPPNQF
jgi:diguanylate cyclase (GGDEF)-like protein